MPHFNVTAQELKDGSIELVGPGDARLNRNSGAHVFTFQLNDNGLGIDWREPQDGLLVAQDNATDCPPAVNSSTQIDDVQRPNPKLARFRNRNNNRQTDMPVSYALHAKCTADPGKIVHPFDPIIINGGEDP